MKFLCSLAAIGVALCITTSTASTASAQMARRDAMRSGGIATAQTRSPAERLAMSRALLDSARQSLQAGEAVLRAGDIARANVRFAEARAMRSAIVPDPSLMSELSAIDAALKNDAEAIAVGSSVLANAAIPPAPSVSSESIPAVPVLTDTRRADVRAPSVIRAPVKREDLKREAIAFANVDATVDATPDRAAAPRAHVASVSSATLRARQAALDSAAASNRRSLATSIDVTAPTPGLDEIGGRVLTVRTFESSSPPAALGARTYAHSFETSATRYVYTEVSVGFVSEATSPSVELTCVTRFGDSASVEQPVQLSHESDASIFLFTTGIGWGEPSRLEPGRYVTTCDHDGTPVLADSFTVTGTTAHSAYVAGETNARAGNWAAAAAAYDSATRLDSTVAEYHAAHGVALERLYDDSAAGAEYAAAIRLAPNELRYHLQYAGALHHLRRLDDAAVEYREVIRLDPDDARRHMVLADLLMENGDRVGALLEYRTAASMDAAEPYYRKRVAELSRKE